jgi:hypothetical protein
VTRGLGAALVALLVACAGPSPSPAGRGALPKYESKEQTYWTAVGVEGDTVKALVNEEGMIEVGERSFSVEPFLRIDDRLVTWSDATIEPSLQDGDLPIPVVSWRAEGVTLTETVFAAGMPGDSVLYASYRLANGGASQRRVALLLALRPFQVNPPWQDLNGAGGASPIHQVRRDGRVVWVNGTTAVASLTEPDGFDAGFLESGALRYAFELAPGARRDVVIAVPFHAPENFLATLPAARDAIAHAERALATTIQSWRERLSRTELHLPAEAGKLVAALHSAVAQLLIARSGDALQPGTRTYKRAWIRDGALMDDALLAVGIDDAPRDFVKWFASHQQADGRVPCCIDARGADAVPEHDSPGELIYAIVSLYRYERDVALLHELWPNVVRAVGFIETLRSQRLGDAWRAPDKRRFYGLLPESISHEGYWKHPVHSYWDDYWALLGLKEAVVAATALGEHAEAARFAALRDAFRNDLRASIEATMRHFQLATIPASADLGDFDPSATSIAIAPGRARALLPAAALARTYDEYMADFRARRSGAKEWDAYTPYELRNAEALVHLGRRDDALFVLREILGDQRPPGWNQWGEIVWRDPEAPKFIGDMPHGWIAAGFVRAMLALFAFERDDGALVLAAGVPLAWARAPQGVAIERLHTVRGPLSYRIEAAGARSIAVTIEAGTEVPPQGIVVRSPAAPLRVARVDGHPAREWSSDSVTVRALPATILLEY